MRKDNSGEGLQVWREKDLKTAPPEEQLREEEVLHPRRHNVMGVFERLPCGSWMQHVQCGSGNPETWVGRREEDWTGRGSWRWRLWAPVLSHTGRSAGRALGSSSKSKNSGNQTCGCLDLEVIYFTTKNQHISKIS